MSEHDSEQAMRDLQAMGGVERYRALLGEPTLRERLYPRRFALAGGAFAAVALAAMAVFFVQRPGLGTRLETAVAEVREVALPDGSRVTLGAQSKLDYQFSSGERSVSLVDGEAFFSVAADRARPFTVSSGDMKVTVLGTEFEIRKRRSEVSVAVADGMVRVSRLNTTLDSRVLRRGETLVLPNTQTLVSPRQADAASIGAWRDGRLIYENAALRDVVEDANRYFSGGIEIADPALADIRVTTSFRTSQVEGMLDTLRAGLPLEIERRSDGSVVLRARNPSR